MPAYEICYLDEDGALTYKFSATCDDDSRAKQLRRVSGSQTNRTGAGDVNGRTRFHAGADGAVIAGWKNIGKHGQIGNLFQRLLFIRKFQ